MKIIRNAIGVLCLLMVLVVAADASLIVNETFGGASTPTGWTIQGFSGGTHSTDGTAKSDADFFGSSQGYLELTDNISWDRGSAYYTDQLVSSRNWTIEAEVNIGRPGSGSDGLAFVFVDAGTINSTDDLQGGYGKWIGAPQGTHSGYSVGYVEGIQGFCFEFDHHWNAPTQTFHEYTHFVDLNTWEQLPGASHDFSGNSGAYYNNGWLGVKLENTGDLFTFSWDYETDGTYDDSYSFTYTNFPTYDAYFGITAATGGAYAPHLVRDFDLDGTATPEPATLALMASGLVGLYLRRRKSA